MGKEKLKENLLISYEALDIFEDYVSRTQSKYNNLCNKMKSRKKKENLAKGIIISLILIISFLILGNLSSNRLNIFFAAFWGIVITFQALTFQNGLWTAVLVYFIFFIITRSIYNRFNKKDLKNMNCKDFMMKYKDEPNFREDFNDYQAIEETTNKLKRSKEFQKDISFIPERYRKSHIVSQLFYYVDDKRADTFKEAIALYEKELFQERIEEEQKLQSAAIRRTEAAANKAAVFSLTSTIFSAASYNASRRTEDATLRTESKADSAYSKAKSAEDAARKTERNTRR